MANAMRTWTVVFALACAFAGCGADSGGASGGDSGTPAGAASAPPATGAASATGGSAPDACALVTKADVEAIVGVPLGEPTKGPQIPGTADVTTSQCVFPSADGMKSLTLLVRHSRRGDSSPGYARQVMADSGAKVEDVPGLADTAFWTGMQLQAFRGTNLQLIVSVVGYASPREAATAVARKALEKI